jgi:ribosome biogenesis GTPase A
VEVSGIIEHQHVVKIRDLRLPLETRRLILDRLRENKQKTIEGKVL